jgi:hypothetical protein
MSEPCAICLDSIVPCSTGRVELSCAHTFHLKCISKWIGKSHVCPLCRKKVGEYERIEDSQNDRETVFQTFQLFTRLLRDDPLRNEPSMYPRIEPRRDIQLIMTYTNVSEHIASDYYYRNNEDVVDTILALTR